MKGVSTWFPVSTLNSIMAVSIDELTATLGAHCDVAANPFDTNKPHPRFAEYSSLREPASLLGNQNKRRAEFLERQKSKREKVVNIQRRLLEETEVDADQTSGEKSQESVGRCPHINVRSKWTFSNQLMMSEWLVDVPPDLEENWLCKPCPKGRRMLVVAHQGSTKAYSKAGHLVATFNSALPAGSSQSRTGITILDCIWNWENRTYYTLDVLAWNNIGLLDCETEFRFFWLQSKLNENTVVNCHSETNRFAFVPLPFIECTEEKLTEMMNRYPMFCEEKDPGLDGMLFYHKSNLYEHGSTPLVTWIKPFMMGDVLGTEVHPKYMEERPPSYIDQADYIREFELAAEARKASFLNRGGRRNKGKGTYRKNQDCAKMDCTEDDSEAMKMDEVKDHFTVC